MTGPRPGVPREATEEAAIRRIVARLAQQFPEMSAIEIERAVSGSYDTFDDSAVRDFIPVLVERATRRQLTEQNSRRHRA
jgi:hypothetical protein